MALEYDEEALFRSLEEHNKRKGMTPTTREEKFNTSLYALQKHMEKLQKEMDILTKVVWELKDEVSDLLDDEDGD